MKMRSPIGSDEQAVLAGDGGERWLIMYIYAKIYRGHIVVVCEKGDRFSKGPTPVVKRQTHLFSSHDCHCRLKYEQSQAVYGKGPYQRHKIAGVEGSDAKIEWCIWPSLIPQGLERRSPSRILGVAQRVAHHPVLDAVEKSGSEHFCKISSI